jgi:hypothetical protein
MEEYLSPILEGFSSPTMDTVFKTMLATSNPSAVNPNVDFLKKLLQQQKDLADSLINSAKIIAPITQKIETHDKAYDAAFETDVTATLPNISGSLQGFTLFFFILSYFSLAIVFSVNINQLTGNTMYAVYSFICFIFLFIAIMILISRFG